MARDHARFGLLFLRNGNWDGKQLISERWIGLATAPSAVNPEYGYLSGGLTQTSSASRARPLLRSLRRAQAAITSM